MFLITFTSIAVFDLLSPFCKYPVTFVHIDTVFSLFISADVFVYSNFQLPHSKPTHSDHMTRCFPLGIVSLSPIGFFFSVQSLVNLSDHMILFKNAHRVSRHLPRHIAFTEVTASAAFS